MAARANRRRASPEKSRPSIFWLFAVPVVPAVGYLAKVEIEGGENLPESGPFVLAPNHYSEIDPLVMAVVVWRLGRAPRFLAKESLFRVPVLGWALRSTGMVPVARSSTAAAARQSLDAAEQLADSGSGVIVYPEGTLTRDPDLWPMRGKTGAVRIALEGDIPLIPIAHWGVQEIMPRYKGVRLWPPRRRVRVRVGERMDLSAWQNDRTPSALAAATTELMDRIAVLQGELRGIEPPVDRWDPSVHAQKETGNFES